MIPFTSLESLINSAWKFYLLVQLAKNDVMSRIKFHLLSHAISHVTYYTTLIYLAPTFSRLIRLTSPNLSYIMGVGAILLYVDVYFTVVPAEDKDGVTVLCNVR